MAASLLATAAISDESPALSGRQRSKAELPLDTCTVISLHPARPFSFGLSRTRVFKAEVSALPFVESTLPTTK